MSCSHWVSVSEPYPSAFNVEFGLYDSYICTLDHMLWPAYGWLTWSLVSSTVTSTMCTYCPATEFCLHRASTINSDTMLSDADS